VWYDGKFVEEVGIPLTTHSLHYGGAVFEGIRFYRTHDGWRAVFRLDDHLERLMYSAGVMEMVCPFSVAELKEATLELIRRSGLSEGYIRPVVFQGDGLGLCADNLPVHTGIIVLPWHQRTEPLQLIKSSLVRLHPASAFMEAKVAGHYVNSRLAALEAKRAGADDGLLLDYKGSVAETSVANVFFINGGRVFTPARGSIFPGLTRSTVISLCAEQGIEVQEGRITLGGAFFSDAMFAAGTACEVLAVSRLGDKAYDIANPVLLRCRELYQQAIRGQLAPRTQWLTVVEEATS
jgi:branched-chain amino acid aminotransferase